MDQFTILAIITAIFLVIPATILPGYRHPHGSIILSSGATLVILAIFCLLGGPTALFHAIPGEASINVVILFLLLGVVLLHGASWTLSLNAAARAWRWLWVALLLVAGLLAFSMIALLLAVPLLAQCLFVPDYAPFGFDCPSVNPLVPKLIVVSYFVGPAAALVYGVRPWLIVRRMLCLGRTRLNTPVPTPTPTPR